MSFKPSVVTLALVAAGYCTSLYAADETVAIDSQASKIEVLQVKGIRRSIEASQALKMENSSIVEAVSAEDIGKLPDVSIAESLARLPGIATQRLDGRANVVSIRGLSPDFTTATLNGREQVTISDNRGVEFDQYPSELMSGVVVYKTPDASVMSQAIGGTVDMRTVRPLAHGEQAIVVIARGEMNDIGKLNPDGDDKGYRASLSYIDQFANDTLGIAFGYAKMSSPNQEERMHIWGYPEVSDTDNSLIFGGAKPYVRSSTLERDGVMGVIEYQPNDKFHSVLDLYYSKFNDKQILRGVEIPGAHWGNGSGNSGFEVINTENGLVTEGILKNQKVLIRNDINEMDADVVSVGWNNSYQLSENWSGELDLSYSKADRESWGYENYAGTSRNGQAGCDDPVTGDPRPNVCQDMHFVMGPQGPIFTPGIDYADPTNIRLGGQFPWGNSVVGTDGQDGFLNIANIKDELAAIRVSATRSFHHGAISSVRFGVNYSERSKDREDEGFYLRLASYEAGNPDSMTSIPPQYLLPSVNMGFIGFNSVIAYDSMALLRDGYYDMFAQSDTVQDRATANWGVDEKVTTGFVMADIDTELFDKGLRGNVGLQVVHTDQSSTGLAAQTDANGMVSTQPSSGGTTYTEVLPSLNLSWAVADSQQVRFAAARTLARPRMDQMNAGYNYSYDASKADSTDIDDSPWSGGGGNPELKPWMAWQYDVSYEVYVDGNAFAIGAFYKDLENYVYEETIIGDFSDISVPDPQPKLTQGYLNSFANGEGGYIRGIEASAHITGKWLSDSLAPFGLIINGALNDSEVRETKDSDPTTLPGLSEKTANATFYYEDHGFQARISARYRSDFLGEVTGVSFARDKRYVLEETVVDAQIGYDFSESSIEALYGLSILFQVTNLTDQEFVTYENGDPRQVKDHQTYGRNYMAGFSYTF
ncbi:TonB-dependent receptor [Paraferrimonas haliotis]|uniref:TonB-dependent receptor n=1 Tax=Paraferrimonas haliotis TaxID=2013866 RepID=A0AA37WY73_9GAMM|nr:TonB-dependent receptor [Paraferrimonas haliotis]GLS83420.1 TonB-dependent receptor [Paraferrimonas haliotis]